MSTISPSTYNTLSALGAGVQALGAVTGGIQAQRTANTQAQISEYNAAVQARGLEAEALQDLYGADAAEYDADLVRQASSFRAQQIRLAGARQQGLNRAMIGASGVTMEGSPLLTLVENAYQIEQQALLTQYEGQLAAQAREREAELRRYSAAVRGQTAQQVQRAGGFAAGIQRQQGRTALTAGIIQGASGLLHAGRYFASPRMPTAPVE